MVAHVSKDIKALIEVGKSSTQIWTYVLLLIKSI